MQIPITLSPHWHCKNMKLRIFKQTNKYKVKPRTNSYIYFLFSCINFTLFLTLSTKVTYRLPLHLLSFDRLLNSLNWKLLRRTGLISSFSVQPEERKKIWFKRYKAIRGGSKDSPSTAVQLRVSLTYGLCVFYWHQEVPGGCHYQPDTPLIPLWRSFVPSAASEKAEIKPSKSHTDTRGEGEKQNWSKLRNKSERKKLPLVLSRIAFKNKTRQKYTIRYLNRYLI